MALANEPVGYGAIRILNVFAFANCTPFRVSPDPASTKAGQRFFSSSMKDRFALHTFGLLRNFPVYRRLSDPPVACSKLPAKPYHAFRAQLMIDRNEGLTKTYNRFPRRPEENAARHPAPARATRRKWIDAVLRAYGWDDLADALSPNYSSSRNRRRKTPTNPLIWPAESSDLVLARLLALNAERHAEEVAAGLAPATRARASDEDDDEAQPALDLE